MRHIVRRMHLVLDVILMVLSTVVGLALRDNLELSFDRILAILPYLLFTTIASIVFLAVFGVDRVIWRFSALPDYLRIATAIVAIVVCTVLLAFAFDRLAGVPRSLPFLQFNVAIILLVGVRVLYRLQRNARLRRREQFAPLKVAAEPPAVAVLLVGLSRLTETYLQSLAELVPQAVRVVGILGHRDRHIGRLVASHKVLGLPEHLRSVLEELEVSGIAVQRIVVATPFASLTQEAFEALSAVEIGGLVKVQYLCQELGLETGPRQHLAPVVAGQEASSEMPAIFKIERDELGEMQKRPYWRLKRLIDIVASLFLLSVSAPLLIVIAIGLTASTGRPPFFWQQRPGLGGRPFWLWKFRTMGAPLGPDGGRLSDEERASRIGQVLRRTRLDELPQLINILRGDMSFIGPRPLLSREQDAACCARLLVRPGLSGWAQVIGGRTISAEDKAALDVWYVRNASFALDVAVVRRTVPMVFFGDSTSESLIDRAWQDLREAGVLKEGFVRLHSRGTAVTA
jgi:lipopolysaccharide/colanic/teichoic acid biosynthesis glycosyltransferase